MKNHQMILFISLCLIGASLAGQPTLISAKIEPTEASPGDSVKVQIEFSGKVKDIQSVTITVREYPYDAPRFELSPSPIKDKSIWTLKTLVPWDAPMQDFNLDISAIAKNGKEIVSKKLENNSTGKTGTIPFSVK